MKKQKSTNITPIKIIDEDFEVEFDYEINDDLEEINYLLETNGLKIEELNFEIETLTNNADRLDYIISVVSGIIAGIVDSLWVGKFSLTRGQDWGKQKTNNFVKSIAQSQGYKGDDLEGSIRHLEQKFPLSSDSNTSDFGGGYNHHLRDFSHHPTIIGLIFSMLTQFSGKAYGTDTNGLFKIEEINNKTFIGSSLPEKFMYGTIFWFFHMVSDIAGSSSNPGAGTGLPGPLLSFAKKISAIPFFNNIKIGDKGLSVWISKLFNGTFYAEKDSNGKLIKESVTRFDFRAELGVVHELGRQAVPVILNECIVRGFYFIRRFIDEINVKEINNFKDLSRIEWKKTLPFKNRTIVRMLTIATGTFIMIDLADAAIRGAINSKGNQAVFAKEFLLRVNFVGIGRFVIAVGTDIVMGIKRENKRNERIVLMSQQLHLMNAKVYYLQANMWKAAESTAKTIDEAKVMMEETAIIAIESWSANRISMNNIGIHIDGVNKHNSNTIKDIENILNWE